jgi:sugar phosphate isomerase/epimerase
MPATYPLLSRRALLAGAPLLPVFAAQRKSKMRFGFTTYLWGRDWDLPTLIANCTALKAYGVEMRVEMKSAHKVELDLDGAQRREVKKRFAGSPVKVIGLATGERFDSPDPAKLQASVEKAKRYLQLSHDIGGRGIRVFPNDFQKGMPQEATIAQVAKSLREVGQAAAGLGQLVRLENHGSAGRLATLKLILDQVPEKNVVVKLNSDVKDLIDGSLEQNFNLVKGRLGDTLHAHDVLEPGFPYQQQVDLLIDAGWGGWWLPEMEGRPKDAMAQLAEQRAKWEQMVAASLKRV